MVTPEVFIDCIMEGVRRNIQALRTSNTLPPLSFPMRGGKPPFGLMRQGNVWVLNPTEIYAMAFAQTWRKEGLTLKQIGRTLAAHGLRSRAGGTYSPSSVLYELLNARVA